MEDKDFEYVGQATARKDGAARVTGQELYTVDMKLPAHALRPPGLLAVRARAY